MKSIFEKLSKVSTTLGMVVVLSLGTTNLKADVEIKNIMRDKSNSVKMFQEITELVDNKLKEEVKSGASYRDIMRNNKDLTDAQFFEIIKPKMKNYLKFGEDNKIKIDKSEYENDNQFVIDLMKTKLDIKSTAINEKDFDLIVEKSMFNRLKSNQKLIPFQIEVLNNIYGLTTLYNQEKFNINEIDIEKKITELKIKYLYNGNYKGKGYVRDADRLDFFNVSGLFESTNSVITNHKRTDHKENFEDAMKKVNKKIKYLKDEIKDFKDSNKDKKVYIDHLKEVESFKEVLEKTTINGKSFIIQNDLKDSKYKYETDEVKSENSDILNNTTYGPLY